MQDQAIVVPRETVSENKLRISRIGTEDLPRFYQSNK